MESYLNIRKKVSSSQMMEAMRKRSDPTETYMTGPVAQWIRHLTSNQGIPGSSPGRVVLMWENILFFMAFTGI